MVWGCADFTLFLHLVEFGMTAALEPQSYRVGLVLIYLVEVISCLSGLVQHSCEIDRQGLFWTETGPLPRQLHSQGQTQIIALLLLVRHQSLKRNHPKPLN